MRPAVIGKAAMIGNNQKSRTRMFRRAAPAPKAVPCTVLERPRQTLVFLTVIVVGIYLLWRPGTFNPALPIFSGVLYAAECFGALTLLLHACMVWRLSVRESPPVPAGINVDVFIPTINEPVAVIRRTALAALAMDYPHRTWILDDGRRPEVRVLADELGCGYLAREDNTHAKAGNLNHALAHTDGELIAVFDADHAPRRNFLLRTLGYFTGADVAFVQTPQDFYNLDSYQHRARLRDGRLWSEQSLFFRVIQRGKDVWNAAFFCGSCAVIRRSALETVGGFATGTVTEDIHTSIRLHKAGFQSVYHAESLAFGIAASQIEPFLRQRIRWGQGAMQVWRKERILFSRRLTFGQKLCYLASILTYFEGWQKAVYYFTPAIVLLSGLLPLHTQAAPFLWHFMPYLVLSLWAFSELGRGFGRVLMIEQYNMIRFAAFCWATLGLFRRRLPFRVTPKHLLALPSHDYYLAPHYLIFFLTAVAIALGGLLQAHTGYMDDFAFSVSILWACVNLTMAGLVLSFTLERLRFRRRDYRFAIPLIATFQLRGGRAYDAAIENISSSGVRLRLAGAPAPASGERIDGHLHLPEGPIPFQAEVCFMDRAGQGGETGIVGCTFTWGETQSLHTLERLLYGSDLEWQVHALNERLATPLERLLPHGHWHERAGQAAGGLSLPRRPMLLARSGAKAAGDPGILVAGGKGGEYLAMAFRPLDLSRRIEARVFNGSGWERLRAQVAKVITPDDGSRLYVYELSGGMSYTD